MAKLGFGMAVLVGLAIYALNYLGQPQRVYGVKVLDCGAHEITWVVQADGFSEISGCGRTTKARCNEKTCDEELRDANTGTF